MRGWLFAGLLLLTQSGLASERVVSLAPFLTDLMLQLEAGERLVGVMDDDQRAPELPEVPRVGGYQTLSAERIIAQRPDLILAWPSGNPSILLDQLESWGMRVERFEPQRLADIEPMVRELGELLDLTASAEQLIADYKRDLARLERPLMEDSPKVFIQLWDDPIYTISDQQLLGDALRHCGARNVFADLRILAPQIGRESVIAADPDIILLFSGEPENDHPWHQRWRQFPQMSAVRNQRLHALDGDALVRPTPRIAEGLADLCAVIWQQKDSAIKPSDR
ncbi:cobalamin-binding protein [Halopseudomonas salegens]|uniref:Iron complex transport system substrate-binding protein/vitamin B12 transport system substrate-binding protein n=1 Tax=Halopseudomonas salegens TaxID=1434072 RepID=A0A1H2EIJ9_9GAMM|nr:cobalamin-binding protein [Halopseudomonas salegens]SDT94588.1 iron complex transport system substrate-binding protein/vitamin B12 transport system substrate-binding protein [Halopseudomonas salegens]